MSSQKENTTQYVRPPIVTIMGHVDHGKTSLLDSIRKTNVTAGEHGGITQHTAAYQIDYQGKKITFIDTPGHAAFSQMRSRGGKVADIVILVVSATEGVKPQTQEAITHAKNSGATIIVAITKMDLPEANVQKVKQELAANEVVVEDWGGDVVCVEVSSVSGLNIDKLLEAILTISEILELKANPNEELEAMIIEAKLDRKKGPMVTCIVRNGTLKLGEKLVASGFDANVKSLTDDKGRQLKEALPSTPVEILGFKNVPNVGDLIVKKGSELVELSIDTDRVEIVGQNARRTISIIVKTDTQGTLEAVKASLASLVTESVASSYSLKFILATTGDINDSDVMLAQSSKGIIVGFNVRLSPNIEELAEDLGVPVKSYKTIYELVDDARDLLEGTALDAESRIKGRAKVLKIFKLDSGDIIAGCKVLAGAIKEGSKVHIYAKDPADLKKEDLPVYVGAVKKLKKGKEEVKLMGKDTECGVLLKPQFEEISEEHWIEVK